MIASWPQKIIASQVDVIGASIAAKAKSTTINTDEVVGGYEW